jgi:hypothetical protein
MLVEDDHVVEAFSTKCADDLSTTALAPRRPHGCSDGIDTDPLGPLPKVAPVHCIAIAEQVPRVVAPRRGLDQLTPHPGGRVGIPSCFVKRRQAL